MKAFLLAAGLGTRLRPLTDTTPKCLVPLAGTTLLDLWLDALGRAGVTDVLVNTHHLADRVDEHVRARADGPRVVLAHEPVLLGSAGTLRAHRAFVDGDDAFLAVNADNLTDVDVTVLVDAHRAGGAVATLAVFRTPRPRECGILTVEDGVVTAFEEKPEHPRGDLANAGMYVFSPAVLDLLDRLDGPGPLDIGHHLLPRLVGAARAVPLDGCYFADIGTPEALARARTDWKGRRAS